MPLSTDTLKNLLDVMQKVSLAITVVSVALFSNVLLSPRFRKGAKAELNQLSKIITDLKWQHQSGHSFEYVLLTNGGINPERLFHKLKMELSTSNALDLSRPVYLAFTEYEVIDSDRTAGGTENSLFEIIQREDPPIALNEFRKAWVVVRQLKIKLVHLIDPTEVFLRFTKGEGDPLKSADLELPLEARFLDGSKISSEEKVLRAKEFYYETTNGEDVFFVYDFSSVLGPVDRESLNRTSNLPESIEHYSAYLSVKVKSLEKSLFGGAVFGPEFAGKTFAQAFPQLEALSENYQNQRLTVLSTVLEKEEKQSMDQLEVFGAKISTNLIPLFGVVALAILLFQFTALGDYITSNVQRLEEEEAAQWSFLLSGWRFFVLSFGTIFLLPVSATVFTFLTVPSETLLSEPISFALAIAVAAFSSIAFVSLDELRAYVLRNPGVRPQAAIRRAELKRRILRFTKAIKSAYTRPIADSNVREVKSIGPDTPIPLSPEQ